MPGIPQDHEIRHGAGLLNRQAPPHAKHGDSRGKPGEFGKYRPKVRGSNATSENAPRWFREQDMAHRDADNQGDGADRFNHWVNSPISSNLSFHSRITSDRQVAQTKTSPATSWPRRPQRSHL